MLEGHTFFIKSVAVSPDQRFIVSGSDDKTAKIWEFESSQNARDSKTNTNSMHYGN